MCRQIILSCLLCTFLDVNFGQLHVLTFADILPLFLGSGISGIHPFTLSWALSRVPGVPLCTLLCTLPYSKIPL